MERYVLFGKKLKAKTLNELELKTLSFVREALKDWVKEIQPEAGYEIERFDVASRDSKATIVSVSGRIRIRGLNSCRLIARRREMVRFSFSTSQSRLSGDAWKPDEKQGVHFHLVHEDSQIEGQIYEVSSLSIKHDTSRLIKELQNRFSSET